MGDRAWSDERYVRLYTRDTPDWLCLSFPAQGLMCLLLRKVTRAGVLELGRAGRRGVFIAVGHAHQAAMLDPALDELLADGCVEIVGDNLVIPNFLEAQEAEASDKARARKRREKVRDVARAGGVTGSGHTPPAEPEPSRDVTPRLETPEPRDGPVTPRDARVTTCDETVTPSRAVPPVPPVPLEAAAAEPEGESVRPVPIHVEATCPTLTAVARRATFGVDFGKRGTSLEGIEQIATLLGTDRSFALVAEAAPRSTGYPGGVPVAFIARVLQDAVKAAPAPTAKSARGIQAPGKREDFSKPPPF
jgi:hypothetical protein